MGDEPIYTSCLNYKDLKDENGGKMFKPALEKH